MEQPHEPRRRCITWRRIGVTEQACFRRRKEYGGLEVDQARRMRELEKENGQLPRAVKVPLTALPLCRNCRVERPGIRRLLPL
jgi:hypothetical protein